MNAQKIEDVKDTALKLAAIKVRSPEDYFYLKGWIHCLTQIESEKSWPFRKFPAQTDLSQK